MAFASEPLLEAIGASAFASCSALRNVTFLPGVTELSESAFRACPLEALVIPLPVKRKGLVLALSLTAGSWRVSSSAALRKSAFGRSTVEMGCMR
jgi:hypothetical protein